MDSSCADHPGGWLLICESACRCTIRHPSASRRNTIVTRSSRVERSVRPATQKRISSFCTLYAKSAPTMPLIVSVLRVPSEYFELAQSSRAPTFSHPHSTRPPKPPQRVTSSAWDQSALNAAGRPCANSASAASSFAMNANHSESASRSFDMTNFPPLQAWFRQRMAFYPPKPESNQAHRSMRSKGQRGQGIFSNFESASDTRNLCVNCPKYHPRPRRGNIARGSCARGAAGTFCIRVSAG